MFAGQPDSLPLNQDDMKSLATFGLILAVLIFAAPAESAEKWKMVWHDEFAKNGPPDPANWNFEQGFVRNEEPQWYQPENAICTNGLLVIEARPEHKPNPNYVPGSRNWKTSREWIECTSASLTTRGLHDFTYGKFEMRARIDTRNGSWPAFWTLGSNIGDVGWPACGEIDIMEAYTSNVLANVDYKFHNDSVWSTVKKPTTTLPRNWSKKFHTWTMEWDDKKIDLLLDGKLMNHLDLASADKADGGNPFRGPLYLILNQALRTQDGAPWQSILPVRFEVDWVRVYQRAN